MIDKNYCMSHYLAFRFIPDENTNFYPGLHHTVFSPRPDDQLTPVATVQELDQALRRRIEAFYVPGKTALLLSGGMDSAILASYLPAGTKAYTFQCVAEGAIDETAQAKKYCDIYGLDHEIIPMYWSDFEQLTPQILQADGVPFHSIEVQLLKAARHARQQGIERLIIGESADLIYGGMDKLIGQDWTFDAFCRRYTFVEPTAALKNPVSVQDVYEPYRLPHGDIDFLRFVNEVFATESSSSYMHAFHQAGIQYLDPYSYTKMALPLDLQRVRNGEPKYMIRQLFAIKYPPPRGLAIPSKIPMPRATSQWLRHYAPTRPEFIPGCTRHMSGDQKWLCWCLEQFLNMHEPVEENHVN